MINNVKKRLIFGFLLAFLLIISKAGYAGPGSWSYVVVGSTWYGAGCHRTGSFGYSIACCPPGYQNISFSHTVGGTNTVAWTNDNRQLLCGPNPPWVAYPANVSAWTFGHGPAACLVSRGYAPNMKVLCAK
jgi:hypothetical protein